MTTIFSPLSGDYLGELVPEETFIHSHFKMKFYRVFNAIYFKSKGANSELVTHLVTHLVWPHEGPISMRPRALRTIQDP